MHASQNIATPASPELRAKAIAFLNSCVERDVDYMLDHSIEKPEGSFSSFNTGGAAMQNRLEFGEHLRPLEKAGWVGLDPAGWVVDTVAWFTAVAHGILPDGGKLPIRVSLIMRETTEGCKVMHVHVSEPADRPRLPKVR